MMKNQFENMTQSDKHRLQKSKNHCIQLLLCTVNEGCAGIKKSLNEIITKIGISHASLKYELMLKN